MPTYRFRCGLCGEFEVWHSIHERAETEFCPTCGTPAQRVMSAPNVIGIKTRESNNWERQIMRDRAAYKRLRDNGIQPPTLQGAARMEAKGDTKWQIESGLMGRHDRTRVREMERRLEDSGAV